jgi:hypothetical protein
MKRPDLIILIAVWHFINAFGTLIGIIAMGVFAFPSVVWYAGPGTASSLAGLSIGVLCLLVFLGVAVAGGIGLLAGKEWGRIMSIVHAALSLFFIPIGTVLGILALIYLVKADVRDYFQAGD